MIEAGSIVRVSRIHKSVAPGVIRYSAMEVVDVLANDLAVVRSVVRLGYGTKSGIHSSIEHPHEVSMVYTIPFAMLEILGEKLQEII